MVSRFKLASLQIEHLIRAGECSLGDLKKALKHLPEDMDEYYDMAMKRVRSNPGRNSELVIQLLTWLFYAKEPLSVLLLQQALSLEEHVSSYDELQDFLVDTGVIIAQSEGLSRVTEDGFIILAHETVQAFFSGHEELIDARRQELLCQRCLAFIGLDFPHDMWKNLDSRHSWWHENSESVQILALLLYASEHWGEHLGVSPVEETKRLLDRSLKKQPNFNKVWGIKLGRYGRWSSRSISPLAVCAIADWREACDVLIARGADPMDHVALVGAAGNGNIGLMKVILEYFIPSGTMIIADRCTFLATIDEATAHPEQRVLSDEHVSSILRGPIEALHEAASKGRVEAVQLISQHGLSLEAESCSQCDAAWHGDAVSGTALVKAVWSGQSDMVRFLVKEGANVNASFILPAAATRCNSATVELLLDAGVQMNGREESGYGDCALQAAARTDKIDVVQLLLRRGADPNMRGGWLGNALQVAAHYGNIDVLQLLIKSGADIHIQGGYFGNALQAAAYGGNSDIVPLLIKNGADIHTQGGEFGNALQAAACNAYVKAMRFLIDGGADVNALGGPYGTALGAAVARKKQGRKKQDVIQLLLDHGADVQIANTQFVEAGHHALLKSARDAIHRSKAFGYKYSALERVIGMLEQLGIQEEEASEV